MLYESLSQPLVFLWLGLFGFLCGFLFDFKSVFVKKSQKFKFFSHFFTFFVTFLTLSTYFFVNLKVNYGQIRLFSTVAFLTSFSIQRLLITNFVAKPLSKCYNKFKEKSKNGKRKKISF